MLRRVAPTWFVQIPWLLGNDPEAVRQSLQWARPERMLREFAALIEALSAERVVVLLMEDLHWSDAATVDLLAVLAERQEPARLLVLGTYRAAELVVHQHPLLQAVRTLQVRRRASPARSNAAAGSRGPPVRTQAQAVRARNEPHRPGSRAGLGHARTPATSRRARAAFASW
jgi:hypothetical protein